MYMRIFRQQKLFFTHIYCKQTHARGKLFDRAFFIDNENGWTWVEKPGTIVPFFFFDKIQNAHAGIKRIFTPIDILIYFACILPRETNRYILTVRFFLYFLLFNFQGEAKKNGYWKSMWHWTRVKVCTYYFFFLTDNCITLFLILQQKNFFFNSWSIFCKQ